MFAKPPNNAALLLPYALPYLAYVGAAQVGAALASPWLTREALCAVQIALASAALAWGAGLRGPLRGPRSLPHSLAIGTAAGAAGAALWIAGHDRFIAPGGDPWSPLHMALRTVAVVGLVPLFEEQLMRGFVLGVATQWDRARRGADPQPLQSTFWERSIAALEPGAATGTAVAISSALFAAGHSVAQWPVAVLYGAVMAALWATRKDLASCVAAHATTNLIQIGYAACTARWTL